MGAVNGVCLCIYPWALAGALTAPCEEGIRAGSSTVWCEDGALVVGKGPVYGMSNSTSTHRCMRRYFTV